MIYFYAYLCIGALIVMFVLADHLWRTPKKAGDLGDLLDKLHPERKTIRYLIVVKLLEPALTGLLILIAWPIASVMMLRMKLSKKAESIYDSDAFSAADEIEKIPKAWLTEKTTVTEAEAANPGIMGERAERFPDAAKPFGFQNRQWENLKALMLPRDEIWKFCSPLESWEHLAGRAGVALVRDGVSIRTIVSMMN
jgi:hypothetical protein